MNYINFLGKDWELDKSQLVTLIDRLLYKHVLADERDTYLSFFNDMITAGVFTDEENPIDLDYLLAKYCRNSGVISPDDVNYNRVADAYSDRESVIKDPYGYFYGRIEKVVASCWNGQTVLFFLVSFIEDLNEFDEDLGIGVDFRHYY